MFESALGLVVGASIIVVRVPLIGHPYGRFAFTAFTSVLFGISMLFNGIFRMGTLLHGLYGIGFLWV
ncbi:MAG: hypothetical protein ABI026_04070 [Gemmatimonadaceae bacterium]